jgi:hypothetical protein
MAFERRNYVLLLIGLGLVAAGYALMAVDNARGLDEAGRQMISLESPLSLVLAPLLLLAGYLEIVYAVLWRPRPAAEPRPAEAVA